MYKVFILSLLSRCPNERESIKRTWELVSLPTLLLEERKFFFLCEKRSVEPKQCWGRISCCYKNEAWYKSVKGIKRSFRASHKLAKKMQLTPVRSPSPDILAKICSMSFKIKLKFWQVIVKYLLEEKLSMRMGLHDCCIFHRFSRTKWEWNLQWFRVTHLLWHSRISFHFACGRNIVFPRTESKWRGCN